MTNPTYTTRKFTIAAGEAVEVYRQAQFISCLKATHAFKLKFNNGPTTDFEAGLTYKHVAEFERVQLVNPSPTDILTVTLAFGRGEIRDARLTLSGQINTYEASPDVLTTIAPVAAVDAATTPLVGLNARRKEVVFSNNGAGQVFIGGDPAAVAGSGIPLGAGGVLVLTTAAAVYARNDSGATVNIGITELEHS